MKLRFLIVLAITLAFPFHATQAQFSTGSVDVGGPVSAAIACADVGGLAVKGLNNLVKKSNSKLVKSVSKPFGLGSLGTDGRKVPTTDEDAQEKLERQNFKENCLDKIAYNVAKQALAQATARTLNWVNTGRDGKNPLYILNQSSFLQSIADEQIHRYLDVPKECVRYEDPRLLTLRAQLQDIESENQRLDIEAQINEIENTPQDAVARASFKAQNAKCLSYQEIQTSLFGDAVRGSVLSQITGRYIAPSKARTEEQLKYDRFVTDFRSGGWNSWLTATQFSQNPVGEYLRTVDRIATDIHREQETARNSLTYGEGFLPQEKCVEYEKKPWLSDPESPEYDPSYTPKCLTWKTVTPASIVADQAKTALQTPIRQLEAADEFNEILGTLLSKVLNRLLNQGVAGLGTFAHGDFTGFGGFGVNSVGASTAGKITVDRASGAGSVEIKNPGSIRDVLKNQYDYASAAHDSAKVIERIAPNLGVLDYCIPGPHQAWKLELGENTIPFLEGIINAKKDGAWWDVGIPPQEIPLYDFVTDLEYKKTGFGIKLQTNAGSFFSAVSGFLGTVIDSVSPFGNIGSGIVGLFSKQTDTTYQAGQFLKFLEHYVNDTEALYAPEKIVAQFSALEPVSNKTYTENIIRASLLETRNLIDVYNNSAELLAEYDDAQVQTQEDIRIMQRIYTEALQIVTTARNRHIAKMKQQGYTVDTQCLDAVYDINPAYTTRPHQESDSLDPTTQQVKIKHQQFYNAIGTGDPGNGTIDEFIPITL